MSTRRRQCKHREVILHTPIVLILLENSTRRISFPVKLFLDMRMEYIFSSQQSAVPFLFREAFHLGDKKPVLKR